MTNFEWKHTYTIISKLTKMKKKVVNWFKAYSRRDIFTHIIRIDMFFLTSF